MASVMMIANRIENWRTASLAFVQALPQRRQSQLSVAALSLSILLVTMVGAEPAYAQNLEGLANRMLSLLSGGLMRTLATIAVICLGAAWWTGNIDGRKAFAIAFGIVIVFAAPFIVSTISGG
jgi:type IV secretion system protein TrbC